MAAPTFTFKKATPPSYSSVVSGKLPRAGHEPPMLAECLIFTSTERASPGSTNGGLRQKRECRLMACAVKRRRFPVGARPTRRFAPAGSNRSSHGGNEMAEAFEMSKDYAQPLHRGTGGGMYTRKAHATREAPLRDQG